jgi:hypothetical protein
LLAQSAVFARNRFNSSEQSITTIARWVVVRSAGDLGRRAGLKYESVLRGWPHQEVRPFGASRDNRLECKRAVLTPQKFMKKEFMKSCGELAVIARAKTRAKLSLL